MAPFIRSLLTNAWLLSINKHPSFLPSARRVPSSPFLTCSTSSRAMSSIDEDALTKWVGEMYSTFTSCTNAHSPEDVQAFWDKYAVDRETIFVRPSGNPLTIDSYVDMATSKDITKHTGELLKVEHIKTLANGQAAVVFFEGSQKFDYKGTPNDDNAKYSVTVDCSGETFKFAFLQRYPGNSNLS